MVKAFRAFTIKSFISVLRIALLINDSTHLPIASDHPFFAYKFFQCKRSTCMQFLCRNTNLCTKAKFFAISKACGAFAYTAAASTSRKKRSQFFLFSDTIASECLVECCAICVNASSIFFTTFTAHFRLRNSLPKSSGFAFEDADNRLIIYMICYRQKFQQDIYQTMVAVYLKKALQYFHQPQLYLKNCKQQALLFLHSLQYSLLYQYRHFFNIHMANTCACFNNRH